MLQEFINKLHDALPGYHFEINIYPAGGIIDAVACEECGTTKSESASWRYGKKGRLQTLDDAVADLQEKLMRSNAGIHRAAEGRPVE